MRKLIYYVATTLDGFIARKDGSADGFLPDGPHIQAYYDSLNDFDTVVMGRKTYEFGFQFGLEPGQPAYTEFRLKNYVISSVLKYPSTDMIKFIDGDANQLVNDLKLQSGKDIYLCGGGMLAGKLLEAKAIDQLIVKLNPIVFGQGIGLFGGSENNPVLKLFNKQSFDNGVQFLSYSIEY